MKLNRRSMLKTAFVGIPGLVLFPMAVKAEGRAAPIENQFRYTYRVGESGMSRCHTLVGTRIRPLPNGTYSSFEIGRWYEPTKVLHKHGWVRTEEVKSFSVTKELNCSHYNITLMNGQTINGYGGLKEWMK